MIRLGVLGSTKGTDLKAILGAINNKNLAAEVSVVISNRENAYILTRAKNHNVPSFFLSHSGMMSGVMSPQPIQPQNVSDKLMLIASHIEQLSTYSKKALHAVN